MQWLAQAAAPLVWRSAGRTSGAAARTRPRRSSLKTATLRPSRPSPKGWLGKACDGPRLQLEPGGLRYFWVTIEDQCPMTNADKQSELQISLWVFFFFKFHTKNQNSTINYGFKDPMGKTVYTTRYTCARVQAVFGTQHKFVCANLDWLLYPLSLVLGAVANAYFFNA